MTIPAPNYREAIDFLTRWGNWTLTAIAPDQKKITTKTVAGPDGARKFLEEFGADRNIYFAVNPLLRPVDSKAGREDVKELAWLHVDIDPRAGEDLRSEQDRALQLLRRPPGGLPVPTVIIFSGGGYQGFWRLREPFRIDGDIERAEEAKLYNAQLEIVFGADECHNVDRIMRLPGTINRPSMKKRRKGRTEALAAIVEWDESRVYDLAQFQKAAPVQKAGVDSGFSARKIVAPGNIQRLGGVDDLPESVPDWCKVLIVQGDDPNEPGRYKDRSKALHAVCCELVRCGVSDEVIYSVITDPDFLISASVLDKGSSIERYALRQIERAREFAIDPALLELNERHAVVGNYGGRCRVIEEVMDEALGRPRLTTQSFDDIRNRYLNRRVRIGADANGNPVMKPLGKWWLEHENRRQFAKVIFAPGREVKEAYNLWRGFACDARPGDCSLFLEHLRLVVCSRNDDHFRYLIGWMARTVQEPASPGYTAIVMRGREGTGKGVFVKGFGSLWGRHFLHISDPKHLVGSFNSHLRDCVVLFGDEAFYAGDKKHESMLKTLVTEETITIEQKGVDAEAAPNFVHLLMASNEAWVVPAGGDNRRFFVLDVQDSHMRDGAYFAKIQAQMDAGGREALLHHLLTYDLKGFEVRNPPKTQALQDQKMLSFRPEEEWWFKKLSEGRLDSADNGWTGSIAAPNLTYDFVSHVKTFGGGAKSSETRFGHFLRRACPAGWPKTHVGTVPMEVVMVDGMRKMVPRPRIYTFPALSLLREHFDARFGGPFDWPEEGAAPAPTEEKEPF